MRTFAIAPDCTAAAAEELPDADAAEAVADAVCVDSADNAIVDTPCKRSQLLVCSLSTGGSSLTFWTTPDSLTAAAVAVALEADAESEVPALDDAVATAEVETAYVGF